MLDLKNANTSSASMLNLLNIAYMDSVSGSRLLSYDSPLLPKESPKVSSPLERTATPPGRVPQFPSSHSDLSKMYFANQLLSNQTIASQSLQHLRALSFGRDTFPTGFSPTATQLLHAQIPSGFSISPSSAKDSPVSHQGSVCTEPVSIAD